MANNTFEFHAKTVEKAIEEGLTQLSIEREQADIEILQRGRSGFLGIGSELAIIKITPLVDSYTIPTRTPPEDVTEVLPEEQTKSPTSIDRGIDDLESAFSPATSATSDASSDLAIDEEDLSELILASQRDLREQFDDGRKTEQVSYERWNDERNGRSPRESRRWRRVTRDELPPDEYAIVSGIPGTDGESDTAILEYATDLMTPEVSNAELEDMSVEMLETIIDLMGFDATVNASWQTPFNEAEEPYLQLDIFGSDVGPLIGRRGDTLDCIQYLVRLMVNQQLKQWKNIIVDIEHYKSRRMEQLTQMSHRLARQVADTGRSFVMEPMPANERRLVHLALRHNPDVVTESLGDGERRQVQIVPK